jgi:hypothetical protein
MAVDTARGIAAGNDAAAAWKSYQTPCVGAS